MKIILFLAVFFVLCFYKVNAVTIGANPFSASFLLTNGQYGTGAVFGGKAWFYDNGNNFRKLRVDYLSNDGTTFMRELYDYATKDKYQVCGQTCDRATFNSAAPFFNGTTPGNYANAGYCVQPDYPSYKACPSGCTSFNSTPAQPQGILNLNFNDTSGTKLCLVRWSVPSGNNYGPEWHMQNYRVSSPWTDGLDPTANSTYACVISGVTCPAPSCYAKLDLAIVVDQSGSIGNAWPTVVNFLTNIVSPLTMGPDLIRVGLVYFSGQTCTLNYDGANSVACGGKKGDCTICGGLWDLKFQGVSSNKTYVQGYISAQALQGGSTCISCGMRVGKQILDVAPRANVTRTILLFTDGQQNCITSDLSPSAQAALTNGIGVIAVGVNQYDYTTLFTITQNNSNIYTAVTFSDLNGLLARLIAPLCDPLPNIASCDFCSGVCD